MNRTQRAATAAETLRILDTGFYHAPDGRPVSIADSLRTSVAGTRTITPAEWPAHVEQARRILPVSAAPATTEVTAETTLAAARRLIADTGRADTLALNFASANSPGGGFISGALAQEESLAVASGLYTTLLAGETYYAANRRTGSKLYTDHAILSPRVPVFRDNDGTLLGQPYLATFLTMPAPNRGAIPAGSPDLGRIGETLRRRITYVLSIAAVTGHRTLVLGAWGCGVFRNDPAEVAGLFADALFGSDQWIRRFDHVTFAVYDRSPNSDIYGAFERCFAQIHTPQGGVT
jgi:uncharacterized protein (TIGR02452 family)